MLLYIAESAFGEMKDLMNEVYVRKETLPFKNLAEINRHKAETLIHPGDDNFKYIINALFMPVDMTDYEENFVGFNEAQGLVPFSNVNWMQRFNDDLPECSDALPNPDKTREEFHTGTGPTFTGIIQDKYTETDPPEYDVYGAEDDDDDDDDDEDYDEEEEDEDYGDYGDDYGAEDPLEADDKMRYDAKHAEERDMNFLRANEHMRDKYSDTEIEQFMNLLNITPRGNWADRTSHHYKLGAHTYEDEN